jgi:exodeoxyribonuclease VIII
MATLDFGTAMHAILLEPELLKTDFVVMPRFNLRTNAGKEEKEQFLRENEGKTVLTSDEREKLDILYNSVMAHPVARETIKAEGLAEASLFWKDEQTGLQCRCRPDKLITSQNRIIDIKTTPDLSKFKYSVQDFRYHVQEAFYIDGIKANGIECEKMEFLVIQKNVECGRYPVAMYTLPWEVVEHGRYLYQSDLSKYANFLESDKQLQAQEMQLHAGFLASIENAQAEGLY